VYVSYKRSGLMSHLLTHRRITHTIIIVALLVVVAPVRGKWNGFATSAQDSESEDEIYDLSATIQSGRHDIVVLDEPIGPVLAEIELGHDSNSVVKEQGAVCSVGEDAYANVRRIDKGRDLWELTHRTTDDCCVPVVKTELREIPVQKIGRERSGKAN
jgi:hypothetical protein